MKQKTAKKYSLQDLRNKPYAAFVIAVSILFMVSALVCCYQNVHAVHALHNAQQLDKQGQYIQAQQLLKTADAVAVSLNTKHKIEAEQMLSQQMLQNQLKLQQVRRLLKRHKPNEALAILKTVHGPFATQLQVAVLRESAQAQVQAQARSHPATTSTSSSSPTSNSTLSPNNAGSAGGNGSGSSAGNQPSPTPTTPPAPGLLSQITINSLTVAPSPGTASRCSIAQAVSFSTNGSGSVSVTWKELSRKTSSAIENPDLYSFSAAGTQTDSRNGSWQGLEAGDSYSFSVTIVDTANGAISRSAGPITVSSCGAPQALQSPGQASLMITPVNPGALTDNQSHDALFTNECAMNLREVFSVTGPGSVQAVYSITSASSGGAMLYAPQQWDFITPGTATDSSYIRMPHLIAGDHYTITVTLHVLGDPAHSASTGPISSGCS